MKGRWLVAVDVGGTFTDAIAVGPSGTTLAAKVPSTPDDPGDAFERAVRELIEAGLDIAETELVFHGTTVATNAVINRQLAQVTLLTTEGFRDVLGYRDGSRPSVYDLEQRRPSELVRRSDCIEVRERRGRRGEVIVPLSDEEIERALDEVARRAPEAIAVSFLFSFLDDGNEKAVSKVAAERFPTTPVTTSAEVAREFREYPRSATAVVNAGLRPIVGRYILRIRSRLNELGYDGPTLIMQSNGGCVPADRADAEAHRLLLSGPAAGVAGTVNLGRECGIDRLVSFDMGGTSLDVCLIPDGVPPVTASQKVGDHRIICPSVDIVTIGAGGGSIADVDEAGRVTVGPSSAGAVPGPAAYGREGSRPTVTDAHVVLGSLPSTLVLAGGLRLDVEASRKVVGALGERLELSAEEAADRIIQVAIANMGLALRRVSVERGLDPEDYTLVSFGGAGPLHSGFLLREMGFNSVLIPPHPGLFAASGLISTDLRIDESRTVLEVLDPSTVPAMVTWLSEGAAELRDRVAADGLQRSTVRVRASADCRYVGQGFELNVPIDSTSPQGLESVARRFGELHWRTYGHADPNGRVEVVTLRLSAFGTLQGRPVSQLARARGADSSSAVVGTTRVHLSGTRRVRRIPVYDRELLRAGHRLNGPAIVQEGDATTLVLDGQRVRVDARANMWVEEA